MRLKITFLILAVVLVSVLIFSRGPIPQIQEYHQFADRRIFMGIPNAMDVLTNICFAIVGLLGYREVALKNNTLKTATSWKWFFLSVLLIAPGSAIYHWSPNDFTLIWDRLPMSMGFMALYVALLSEHIDLKSERWLPHALIVGIISVLIWVISNDLRLYFIVQFSSFVTIPLILILFRSHFTLKAYYGVALFFYALAKWAESKDHQIFALSGELISGHSLKHLLAGAGLMCLWPMVRWRKEQEN
jgi:hypothetical protein